MDQFFKEALESPDLNYEDKDWQSLEKLLADKSRKRNLLAWRMLAGIAAALLIFFSLWFFRVNPVSEKENNYSSLDRINKSVPIDEPKPLFSDRKPAELKILQKPNQQYYSENISSEKKSGNGLTLTDFTDVKVLSIPYVTSLKANNNGTPDTETILTDLSLSNASQKSAETTGQTIRPKSDISFRRTSFSLGLSPDLNSAEKFNTSSLGTSFGIGASYRITKSVNLNSGLYYSKKIYSANPENYKSYEAPFNYAQYARSIDADCRVLDIPVNIGFNLANKPKQTVFASVGLSSYFMMKEKYTFIRKTNSGYPATGPEPSYTIDQKNNHIFSVINIAAGISKPIGKNTDIIIQPYAKLPFTGIGQGKINLQSIGVAFQLNYKFEKK